ncbi:MAG: hypothetical protein JWO11_4141 [Nocardioides sp.]|nr:hypothetical protein [Nocardioides sp.]
MSEEEYRRINELALLVAARDAERVATLREAADRLEATYATARAVLKAEADSMGRIPEEMRDAAGRFILLDAVVAIVQARAALAHSKAE